MGKRGRRGRETRRGDVGFDSIITWILAVLVLIAVGAIIVILAGKGGDALGYLKSVFRFGR